MARCSSWHEPTQLPPCAGRGFERGAGAGAAQVDLVLLLDALDIERAALDGSSMGGA